MKTRELVYLVTGGDLFYQQPNAFHCRLLAQPTELTSLLADSVRKSSDKARTQILTRRAEPK